MYVRFGNNMHVSICIAYDVRKTKPTHRVLTSNTCRCQDRVPKMICSSPRQQPHITRESICQTNTHSHSAADINSAKNA